MRIRPDTNLHHEAISYYLYFDVDIPVKQQPAAEFTAIAPRPSRHPE